MPDDRVDVELAGGVARLTMRNPGKRNALTTRMYDELERACAAAAADPQVRVVVLRGAGGAFAGGTDIRELADVRTGDDGVAYEARIRRVLAGVAALRVPLVAVVEGPAVGGGLVLAALADVVVCTPEAVFGSPIARTLGNCLSPSSLARLHATLGRRLTAEVLLTGRLLAAEEARAAGFVSRVVPPEELDSTVDEIVAAVVRCAPRALAAVKELESRLDAAAWEVDAADVYRSCYGSDDFREGVAAFLEKRAPRFTGR